MKGTHERKTDVNGLSDAADQRKAELPMNLPALKSDAADTAARATQPGLDPASPDPVRIPPRAFLRAMAAIAWSSFRRPFSTTVIDLSTGKVVREA